MGQEQKKGERRAWKRRAGKNACLNAKTQSASGVMIICRDIWEKCPESVKRRTMTNPLNLLLDKLDSQPNGRNWKQNEHLCSQRKRWYL